MPTAMMQLIVIYYAHWTMDGDIYYALSTVDEIWEKTKNWPVFLVYRAISLIFLLFFRFEKYLKHLSTPRTR
jgi:hypothetical protein